MKIIFNCNLLSIISSAFIINVAAGRSATLNVTEDCQADRGFSLRCNYDLDADDKLYEVSISLNSRQFIAYNRPNSSFSMCLYLTDILYRYKVAVSQLWSRTSILSLTTVKRS